MFDLDAIQSAKSKAKAKQVEKESSFDEEYEKAVAALKQFQANPEQETLNQAMGHFVNALMLKRTKVEVYFFISYIFYLLGNKQLAREYLDYAGLVDENFIHLEKLSEFVLGM